MRESHQDRENQIRKLLEDDPQEAVVMMVEHYTGLLWTVAGRYLSDPEDIKECINDTFTEFYCHRERYDETRGSMAAYLSAIAGHQAISRYRSNRRHKSGNLPGEWEDTMADQVDERLDLENAIQSLGEEDAAIIRMKYYEGMTVRKIADSLHIPYETVKKRHQRSLKKMRLFLLTLLCLLLAAGLAACAYKILQHFGIVPGYGVNRSDTVPFYVLEETVTVEDDQILLRLDRGIMTEDSLVLTIYAEYKDAWYEARNLGQEITAELIDEMGSSFTYFDPVLILEDGTIWSDIRLTSSSDLDRDRKNPKQIQIIFEPLTGLIGEESAIPMTLQSSYGEFPFVFAAAEEEAIDGYSYVLEEQGGLLAIPCLEEGRLYVDIYPLNCGDYTTDPGLIRGVYETIGGPKGEVTVTGTDGSRLVGQCLGYRPFGDEMFFRWDFGPAREGDYVLQVPYVYQTARLPEGFSFAVSDAEPGTGRRLEIPGSVLTIVSYSGEQPPGTTFNPDGDQENAALRRFLCFDVEMEEMDRVLVGLPLEHDVETPDEGKYLYGSSTSLLQTHEEYMDYIGYAILLPQYTGEETVIYSLIPHRPIAAYQWNHAFSVPFRVDAED